MTFAFNLFTATFLVLLIALGMEALMCGLALRDISKNKEGLYWDDEKKKFLVRDYEMEEIDCLEQTDYWYPNGTLINSLTEKVDEKGW